MFLSESRNLRFQLLKPTLYSPNQKQLQQVHRQQLSTYLIRGASSSGVTFDFSPISPLQIDDPDTMFGDDRDDFQDINYSPFNV